MFELSTKVEFGTRLGGTGGFISAMALGNLLLVVTGARDPGYHGAVVNIRTEPSILQRLWPRHCQETTWPPPIAIDGQDLANVAALVVP